MQQAVLQVGALHLDMVGELEAPLERASRDAAVQELTLLLLGLLLTLDVEDLLLDVDLQLILAEAGDRHGDAVLVLAEPLDVVRRVCGRPCVEPGNRVEHVEQPVEADGGAIEGGKIDLSHHKSSLGSDVVLSARLLEPGNLPAPRGQAALVCAPIIGVRCP